MITNHKCVTCGCEVVDGENGEVSVCPWDNTPQTTCNTCIAWAEWEGEQAQVLRSIEAAARAGRFDLI